MEYKELLCFVWCYKREPKQFLSVGSSLLSCPRVFRVCSKFFLVKHSYLTFFTFPGDEYSRSTSLKDYLTWALSDRNWLLVVFVSLSCCIFHYSRESSLQEKLFGSLQLPHTQSLPYFSFEDFSYPELVYFISKKFKTLIPYWLQAREYCTTWIPNLKS